MTDPIKKVTIGTATLFCGDSLRMKFPPVDAVITDPVWPNIPYEMLDTFHIAEDPEWILRDALANIKTKRTIIILRYDCDPRFLGAVPKDQKFLRVLSLPYALPSYVGRTLGGQEYGYLFGEYPSAEGFQKLLPGQCKPVQYQKNTSKHPCPRHIKHMEWLCRFYVRPDEVCLDPFMGTGTTGVACVRQGKRFIGVERVPEFFEEACDRISDAARQGNLF